MATTVIVICHSWNKPPNRFKLLEDSIRQKISRDSTSNDHTNDDGSDEDDDEFELEGLEEDSATFPTVIYDFKKTLTIFRNFSRSTVKGLSLGVIS